MKYRPEVDGLRALAVLPVMLFHAGFGAFRGGFVGVDVFFVISGYLITSLIIEEMEAGRFSLARFYERRARRILPALFVVVLACLPFARSWLLPGDLIDFSQSLAAVAVFSSNILFWRETGYFDTAAELKPLLHTWSLGVEEQYYLLFPLLLLVLFSRVGRNRLFGLLAAAAGLSFGLALWGTANQPSATFYLLPTRGWEILLGALVALGLRSRNPETPRVSPMVAEAGSLAGLILVLGAVFLIDDRTAFPGLAALAPTGGTALLLAFGGPATSVGRWLAVPALVRIGLISYSAYLWHQPMLAFARHRSLDGLSLSMQVLLPLGALLLAFLTWRFIEVPFRDRARVTRKQVLAFGIAGSLAIGAIGVAGIATGGRSWLNPELMKWQQELEVGLRPNHGLSEACEGQFVLDPGCRTGEPPEVLLWGESHAMHLAQGLLASRPGMRLVQMTRSVCGPVIGLAPLPPGYTGSWARSCLESNARVMEWLRTQPSVRYVVLGSYFGQYLEEGWRVLQDDGKVLPASETLLVPRLRHTLDAVIAMGKEPVLFAPTPLSGRDNGRCLARATLLSVSLSRCDFGLQYAARRQKIVYEILEALDRRYRVVWLKDGICEEGRCRASAGSTFLFRDGAHLTPAGSAMLGRRMGFWNLIIAKEDTAP